MRSASADRSAAPSADSVPQLASISTSLTPAGKAVRSPQALTPSPTTARSEESVFRHGCHKSCDACKTRKVKCQNTNYPAPCSNCTRRNERCHFGAKRVPRRNVTKHLRYTQSCTPDGSASSPGTTLCYVDPPDVTDSVVRNAAQQEQKRQQDVASPHAARPGPSPAPPSRVGANISTSAAAHSSSPLCSVCASGPAGSAASAAAVSAAEVSIVPTLYIDRLLAQAQSAVSGIRGGSGSADGGEAPFVKGNGIFGGSYSMTFFSESRLLSLSTRLRNNKVNELVRRINSVINYRLHRTDDGVTASAATATATTSHSNKSNTNNANNSKKNNSNNSRGNGNSTTAHHLQTSVDLQFAAACIRSYFERAHPLYPFLDRAAFEARALPVTTDSGQGGKDGADGEDQNSLLARSLSRNKAWASLYYSVLAIGCVHSAGGAGGEGDGGGGGTPAESTITGSHAGSFGSFEPGKGTAWRIFSLALANLSDLLVLPDSLLTLQALTAMAVYSLGVACLSIERVILSEASRRAQSLANTYGASSSSHSSSSLPLFSSSSALTFQRTFWVVYGIEKVMSFHLGRSSVFADSHIACPFPSALMGAEAADMGNTPSKTSIGHILWLAIWARHGRLLARTYASLFSVGTERQPTACSLATIDALCGELEAWRLTIPETRGERPSRAGTLVGGRGTNSSDSAALRSSNPTERMIALALRFLYHSLVLILERTRLHYLLELRVGQGSGLSAVPPVDPRQIETSQEALMAAARAILELTPLIDVEPHMPLWMLAVIPLTALVVLFDLVVHHPGGAMVGCPSGSHSGSDGATQGAFSPYSSAYGSVRTTGPGEDTTLNLALLDMSAGYFSRIEYVSASSLPGSLVSEFAHIARDYINDYQRRGGITTAVAPQPPPPPGSAHTAPQAPPVRAYEASCCHGMAPSTSMPVLVLQQPEQQQQPLPPPFLFSPSPPLPPHATLVSSAATTTAVSHQQQPPGVLMNSSSLASWPSTSGAAAPLPHTDGVCNGNSGNADGYEGVGPVCYGDDSNSGGDGSGVGSMGDFGDFSGTDVMGLFTSNFYFLPDIDGIMYNEI